MNPRIMIEIKQDQDEITEHIRQFVMKKFPLESNDNGISVTITGDISLDFVEQKITFYLQPITA